MTTANRRRFLQQVAGGAAVLALEPELRARRLRSRDRVDVAVVGVGKWGGRPLLTELAKFEQVRVAAVCDRSSGALRKARRRAPDAEGYESLDELLTKHPQVGAVFVATPTPTHKDIVLQLLDAGKHVYVETPLAHSLEDMQAIASAGSRASTVVHAGHLGRTNPVYDLARSFLVSGAIRDLVYLRAQSHQKHSWRSPSGQAEDDWALDPQRSSGLPGELGSHAIDNVLWFTDKVPSRVRGSGAVLVHKDGRSIPDTVECTLTFPGDLRMQYDATLGNSYEGNYQLFGGQMGTIKMADTHGWMFKEADAPQQGWEVYATRESFHNETGIILIADATKLASQGKLEEGIGLPNPPLYYGVEAFLKSVLEQMPIASTVAEALRSDVVALRCHEAVMAGGEVEIDPADLQVS